MQEKHLFEYAVIRIVPRVEREEFLNVGVIVYCRDQSFLQTKFTVNKERLLNFHAELDLRELEKRLCAIKEICAGTEAGGPIARLSTGSRFRWLTAARSTILQTSAVHPGLCDDANETLNKIYEELVE